MKRAYKKTDGLYTSDKNILLTLMYADCVPIFFYAPTSWIYWSCSCGLERDSWRNCAQNGKTLQSEGVSANEILVVIGPSICQNCYVVDDKVIDKVQKLLEEYDEKPYNLISEGQYQLDLKQLNMLLLEKAGIPKSHIEISTYCTSCHDDIFFSHRRDKGHTGRMMSFIGWKEDIE